MCRACTLLVMFLVPVGGCSTSETEPSSERPGLIVIDAAALDRPIRERAAPMPTLRVNSPLELRDALRSEFKGCILIPKDANWLMEDPCGARDEFGRCVPTPMINLQVQSGVCVMGERGELGSRPTLRTPYLGEEYALFKIESNDVVIRGLHLQGPENGKRDTASLPHYQYGVQIIPDPVLQTGRHILVADNEMDEWPGAGVNVEGTVQVWDPAEYQGPRYVPADAGLIQVQRNYFHHNARDGGGYGVVVGGNAFVTIEGNVFDFNRHAIASSGRAFAGYFAKFNYVLRGGFTYGSNGYYGQHFDVHGTATPEERAEHHYDGGAAGERYEISFNTFRGDQEYGGFLWWGEKTRAAFELRGRPALGATFTDNVLVHNDRGAAVRLKRGKDGTLDTDEPGTFNLTVDRNQYDKDYATELATGDFDGDGRTDIFGANGTAWFFSSAGIAPWDFLHASTKRTHQLAFADIDNDRYTDVLYRDDAGNLGYLKAGRGHLAPLTTLPLAISGLRFGDFDADGLMDMFYTKDNEWHVWYGSTRDWDPTPVQTSGKPIGELLFGDFDEEPGTDVVGINSDGWAYSSSARGSWVRFNKRLSRSFANAIAIDLNGNGRTDILVDHDGESWNFSRDGRGELEPVQTGLPGSRLEKRLKDLPVGRFDGGREDRIITFRYDDDALFIWRGLLQGISFSKRSMVNMR